MNNLNQEFIEAMQSKKDETHTIELPGYGSIEYKKPSLEQVVEYEKLLQPYILEVDEEKVKEFFIQKMTTNNTNNSSDDSDGGDSGDLGSMMIKKLSINPEESMLKEIEAVLYLVGVCTSIPVSVLRLLSKDTLFHIRDVLLKINL
jgi:hypothetical protein